MGSLTDAIKDRITIIDYMEKKGIPYTKKGSYYQTLEKDSLMIKPDKKHFTRYSNDVFGSVIDFSMEYNGVSKDEAIKELRGMLGGEEISQHIHSEQEKPANVPTRADFVLPPKHEGKFSRLYAYLNKTRGISPKVITDMVNRKMLYEDKQYHNAVWVGYDYDGVARFGCKRITIGSDVMRQFVIKNNQDFAKRTPSGIFISENLSDLVVANVEIKQKMLEDIMKNLKINRISLAFGTKESDLQKKKNTVSMLEKLKIKSQIGYESFDTWNKDKERMKNFKAVEEPFVRGDIEGSNKNVGLFINNSSASLLVCEAPIDAMSLMTLLEHHKVTPEKYSYLAQGGVCLNSLEYHIKHQPGINTVYLCYDNDDAGHKARGQSRELLKKLGFDGKIIDKPPHNKDWNDDLRAVNTTIKENIYEQTQLFAARQKDRGLKQWILQK